MTEWHLEILGRQQQRTLQELGPALRPIRGYLVGGTALALHLGHRRSVDMDFFLYGSLDEPRTLVRELQAAGIPLRVRDISEKAIHGTVRGVKLTILSYDHMRLRRTVRCPALNCELAAMDDLAAMKLSAVRLRAARRDYVDIWAMLRSGRSMQQMLNCYLRKFEVEDCRKVVHQLLNFDKLANSRMPRMLWKVRWSTIQAELTDAVNPFLF